MPKIKIERIDPAYDNKWLKLYEVTFSKDDFHSKWVFASRRNQDTPPGQSVDAVVVVPILIGNPKARSYKKQGRKLVVIKEYRIPIRGYEYHFPAGLLEKGEALEDAVRRELREETGFEMVGGIKKVSPPLFSSSGMTDESAVMAFVECVSGGEQQLEAIEDIEVLLLDEEEVAEFAQSTDKNIAAKAWPVLLMFGAMGKLRIPK